MATRHGGETPDWAWREGVVDSSGDYLELRHGPGDADPKSWILVARVGPPDAHIFPIEWLINREDPANSAAVADVRQELDFYLLDVGRPDPWSYANYHCGTAANLYSSVHWGRASKQRLSKQRLLQF